MSANIHPLLKLLRTPLPPFSVQSPDDDDDLLTVQAERKGTTSKWAQHNLGETVLRKEVLLEEYIKPFEDEVNKHFPRSIIVPVAPATHPCRYPRTEGDTVDIICTQIVNLIVQALSANKEIYLRWIPQTNHYPHLPITVLKFYGEVTGEAYVKRDQPNIPGVRVDKLFIISASRLENRTITRQHQINLDQLQIKGPERIRAVDIRSQNQYLGKDQLWVTAGLSNVDWKDQRNKCKAMLPIEIKNIDSIHEKIFDWITKHVTIGGETSHSIAEQLVDHPLKGYENKSDRGKAAVMGTLSMIQQAVRYGVWYGVEAVILTDYKCGILIEIPEHLHGSHTPSEPEVSWAFIPNTDLRIVIAAVFWKSCRKLDDALRQADLLAAAAEEKRKQEEAEAKAEAEAAAAEKVRQQKSNTKTRGGRK
ncbi:hypothetical protein EIP86_007403 [Pleurotus ostreatoroseus]|nr:hypothetical protein EIP86_007403 [Pleurotus ostreatoroseus]